MEERFVTRSPKRRVLAAGIIGLLVFGGCRSSLRHPDPGDLSDGAPHRLAELPNPIIVIPGLLGSKLVDSQTQVVAWGTYDRGSSNPKKPEGAQLAAIPMRKDAKLADLRDDVRPAEVLDKFRLRFLGLPMKRKAYVDLLAALGSAVYRDEELGSEGASDQGDAHLGVFQFAYDFRRDNVENAQRLHEFILEKHRSVQEETRKRRGYERPDLKFDIVAHSMGALLVRYYLRYGTAELPEDGSLPELTWAGAEYVERVVMAAPPNAGIARTLLRLVRGRRFGVVGPRYPPAVLGTFPSMYQNLPRARHRSVRWVGDPTEPIQALDLLSPELWQRMHWGLADPDQDRVLKWLLPALSDPAERLSVALDHQRKCLVQARRFLAALDRLASIPGDLRFYLIAGDAKPTAEVIAVDSETGEVEVIRKGQGDGLVLRSSALMDERRGESRSADLVPAMDYHSVVFLRSSHLGMTKDPSFIDNVLRWLLEDRR